MKGKKTKPRFILTLESSLKKRLEDTATILGCSQANVVKQALAAYFEKGGNDEKIETP